MPFGIVNMKKKQVLKIFTSLTANKILFASCNCKIIKNLLKTCNKNHFFFIFVKNISEGIKVITHDDIS